MNRIYKALLFISVLCTTIIIGLAVAGYILRDRIIEASINQLNKQLDASLKVKDVKVSLLRGFPRATVIMRKVEIIEGALNIPPEFEPGLLSAEELSIQIGLLGLLRNEYNIDKITLKNGWLNLYFDQLGKGNFEIFKNNQQGRGTWLLDIGSFSLDNVTVSYIDIRTGWIFKGLVENANLKGRATKNQMLVHLKTKGNLGVLRQGSFYYIRNQQVLINTSFLVSDESIILDPSETSIGNSKFKVNGVIGLEMGSRVSLLLNGDNLSIETLVSLLSQYNFSIPRETRTKGQIAFDLSIDGLAKTESPYELRLNFRSERLDVQLPNKPIFSVRMLKGHFSNGNLGKPESSELNLENFIFLTGNSQVGGSLRLKNIVSPLFHLNVKQKISVPDVLAWGIDLPLYQGELEGVFESLGYIDDIGKITVQSFEDSKFYSDLTIRDFNFKEVGRIPRLESVSGFVKINNQDIVKSNLSGILQGSAFQAEFNVVDATALLFNKKKAVVNASITIDSLNTSWLLAYDSEPGTKSEDESTWDRIYSVTGDLFVDQLVHNNFVSKPLSANFYLKDNQLLCNSFLGRSCNGIFTGRFSVRSLTDGEFSLSADVSLEGVEIKELFESFNNFEQDVITDKNISGRLDGNLVFSTSIRNGAVERNGFEANSRVKVSDGRLLNVKQLESLSKFIELDDLRDIRFSDMENEITIKSEEIRIPQMNVESSALNMVLSGRHTFNGEYLYHIQLLLSDVLFKKASSRKADNSRFGEVADDGSGKVKLFLKLEGDSQKHSVSYDRASARTNFRDNMRQERESLKSIIKDEFSFLRKSEVTDDSLKRTENQNKSLFKSSRDTSNSQKTSPKFKIEWDED